MHSQGLVLGPFTHTFLLLSLAFIRDGVGPVLGQFTLTTFRVNVGQMLGHSPSPQSVPSFGRMSAWLFGILINPSVDGRSVSPWFPLLLWLAFQVGSSSQAGARPVSHPSSLCGGPRAGVSSVWWCQGSLTGDQIPLTACFGKRWQPCSPSGLTSQPTTNHFQRTSSQWQEQGSEELRRLMEGNPMGIVRLRPRQDKRRLS